MLFNNAQDIISLSYFKLGDLTLARMRNHADGYGSSQKQKQLYEQSRIIRLNLGSVLDHVSYDDNGNLESVLRSTDEQINRFLKVLESVAEINDYATAPTLFHKIKRTIYTAPSVLFQYSLDGSSWHSSPSLGDVYFRTSVDGGNTWSSASFFGVPSGTMVYVGDYDISTNNFPIAPLGTGAGGAIMKGNVWNISVSGSPSGEIIESGATIIAKINNPGQTLANWKIIY